MINRILIIGCLVFILVIYPLIVYLLMKTIFIPSIIDTVVGDSLFKVNKLMNKQLENFDKKYLSKYYNKAVEDINLLVDKTVDKTVNLFDRAQITAEFL